MGNSVEGRFPFLDYRLVDFANKLPAEYKLSGLDEKHILKKAFSYLVPDSILNRPKQPYRSPDAMSFFGNHKFDWIDEITDGNVLKDAGIFNPSAVEKLVSKCRKKEGKNMSNSDNMMITAVLSTMLLYKNHIQNPQPFQQPARACYGDY